MMVTMVTNCTDRHGSTKTSIASADGVQGWHHVSTIAERPDQPSLPFFQEIHQNACLRHYIICANKSDNEKELVELIKEGCVREFKDFYQNRQNFQPMLTLQDCEMLAKQFEEDTEPGKVFTQKCRSYAKAEHVMAAEVKTQNLVPGKKALVQRRYFWPKDVKRPKIRLSLKGLVSWKS